MVYGNLQGNLVHSGEEKGDFLEGNPLGNSHGIPLVEVGNPQAFPGNPDVEGILCFGNPCVAEEGNEEECCCSPLTYPGMLQSKDLIKITWYSSCCSNLSVTPRVGKQTKMAPKRILSNHTVIALFSTNIKLKHSSVRLRTCLLLDQSLQKLSKNQKCNW